LINGLHELYSDITELADFAKSRGLEIIDVRKPKKVKDLHFWSGEIKDGALSEDCVLD